MAQAAAAVPFTAASHRYREKIFTATPLAAAASFAAADMSPPGGAIKSYGYLRSLDIHIQGSGGTGGTFGTADGPFNFFSQMSVTQPNGEELYGGPTYSGWHGMLASAHAGRFLNDDFRTFPSFASTVTAPTWNLTIPFEINPEYGLGSLPNQDFSAPWKLQLTRNSSTNLYQTTPTTTPAFTVDVFMNCWTVPSPTNPLNPQMTQEVAPALLGTLSKWTIQQYTISGGSNQNVLLQRKGNAIRELIAVIRGAANVRQAVVGNFPDPLTIRWDGTVIRSNDRPTLIIDDYYRTAGGIAAATPLTTDTGVVPLLMSDVAGIDAQGAADGFGMNSFWGTVQSSTLEYDGTWGASVTLLEVLTNDVQFVNLAGNPYAFAYSGYLQAPAQPIARP
jgi:hypothetical protein